MVFPTLTWQNPQVILKQDCQLLWSTDLPVFSCWCFGCSVVVIYTLLFGFECVLVVCLCLVYTHEAVCLVCSNCEVLSTAGSGPPVLCHFPVIYQQQLNKLHSSVRERFCFEFIWNECGCPASRGSALDNHWPTAECASYPPDWSPCCWAPPGEPCTGHVCGLPGSESVAASWQGRLGQTVGRPPSALEQNSPRR